MRLAHILHLRGLLEFSKGCVSPDSPLLLHRQPLFLPGALPVILSLDESDAFLVLRLLLRLREAGEFFTSLRKRKLLRSMVIFCGSSFVVHQVTAGRAGRKSKKGRECG